MYFINQIEKGELKIGPTFIPLPGHLNMGVDPISGFIDIIGNYEFYSFGAININIDGTKYLILEPGGGIKLHFLDGLNDNALICVILDWRERGDRQGLSYAPVHANIDKLQISDGNNNFDFLWKMKGESTLDGFCIENISNEPCIQYCADILFYN